MSSDAVIPKDEEKVIVQNTIWTHVLPFLAWLVVMSMLPPAGWSYAVRTVGCLALFFWCSPWRWYPRLNIRNMPLALLVGVVVAVVWVAPEAKPLSSIPWFEKIYQLLFMLPPWGHWWRSFSGAVFFIAGCLKRIFFRLIRDACTSLFFWRWLCCSV